MSGMPAAFTRAGNRNNININYEKVQINMEKFLSEFSPLLITFLGINKSGSENKS
jgi:hypothetical protein